MNSVEITKEFIGAKFVKSAINYGRLLALGYCFESSVMGFLELLGRSSVFFNARSNATNSLEIL